MNNPEQLNALVDAVARQMTAGPAPRLRARVAARLEGLPRAKPRGRSPRPMFWTMGAVATAACAVMLFVMSRPAPGVPVAPPVATATPTVNVDPTGAAAQALGTRHSTLASAQRPVSSAPSAEASAPSPDQLAWQADAIPALEALQALTLESIQPEQLELRPLTMAPLDVPVIGAEDE